MGRVGSGGGGIPPEAPGNQALPARGSADRMVISGRLLSLVWSLCETDLDLLMAARMEDKGPWLEWKCSGLFLSDRPV